jgi:hypothetical protein
MSVACTLKGIMITGIYARRFFAMTAYCSKSGVFAQRTYAVILRMIKITATGFTFLAFIADIQVNK